MSLSKANHVQSRAEEFAVLKAALEWKQTTTYTDDEGVVKTKEFLDPVKDTSNIDYKPSASSARMGKLNLPQSIRDSLTPEEAEVYRKMLKRAMRYLVNPNRTSDEAYEFCLALVAAIGATTRIPSTTSGLFRWFLKVMSVPSNIPILTEFFKSHGVSIPTEEKMKNVQKYLDTRSAGGDNKEFKITSAYGGSVNLVTLANFPIVETTSKEEVMAGMAPVHLTSTSIKITDGRDVFDVLFNLKALGDEEKKFFTTTASYMGRDYKVSNYTQSSAWTFICALAEKTDRPDFDIPLRWGFLGIEYYPVIAAVSTAMASTLARDDREKEIFLGKIREMNISANWNIIAAAFAATKFPRTWLPLTMTDAETLRACAVAVGSKANYMVNDEGNLKYKTTEEFLSAVKDTLRQEFSVNN